MRLIIKARKLPEGTIREHGGVKKKKVGGQWVPVKEAKESAKVSMDVLNQYIKEKYGKDIKMYKGPGYFYFDENIPSIYVHALKQASLGQWKSFIDTSMAEAGIEPVKEVKFSKKMLDDLRAEYGKFETVHPDSPGVTKLQNLLDTMPTGALEQLADAKIKFVSGLARNRVLTRKMGHG